MRRNAWFFLGLALGSLYYLSSIPGLKVLPILKQVNKSLKGLDISITGLASKLTQNLPRQLSPAKTMTSDFLAYTRQHPAILEFMLRKTAHVTVFFIITAMLLWLFTKYTRNPGKALSGAIIAGTLLAFLDECHQSFVVGRTGSMIDVMIDVTGVGMAVLLFVTALLMKRWLD